ncbi:MAG: hypothetical protein U0166_07390 [Acidobacteriota bacterium]
MPFDPQRVHGVEEVNAGLPAGLLHQVHRRIEVAGDLERACAVGERLAELAVGDVALRDEDVGLHPAIAAYEASSSAEVLPVEAQATRERRGSAPR